MVVGWCVILVVAVDAAAAKHARHGAHGAAIAGHDVILCARAPVEQLQ